MAGDGVIDVPLFLHGAAEVAGVQVEVRFDSAQVEVTGVRTGALFTGDWEVQSNLRAPRRLVVLAHCGLNGTPVRGGDAGVRAWVQVRTVERARAPVSRALAGNAKAVTGGGGDCVGGAGERGVDGATTRLCGGWHLLAPPLASVTGELADLFGPLGYPRGSDSARGLVTYG